MLEGLAASRIVARVDQHDDEEEEDHDPAGVDEDLHGPDELRLLEDEDAGDEQERQQQVQSAEWTGFFATTTAIADSEREDRRRPTKSQPAVPVSSAPSGHRAYPRSTTVNGLTFGASRQSVSLRMSR